MNANSYAEATWTDLTAMWLIAVICNLTECQFSCHTTSPSAGIVLLATLTRPLSDHSLFYTLELIPIMVMHSFLAQTKKLSHENKSQV